MKRKTSTFIVYQDISDHQKTKEAAIAEARRRAISTNQKFYVLKAVAAVDINFSTQVTDL